jgi:hypothetical protein
MEDMGEWRAENWFTILNAVGVIGGLFFTAFALISESKTRRIANLLTITANHREVWKEFFRRPELGRVLDASADLARRPITLEEELFVNLIVLHTSSVYYALNDELVIKLEGLRRDIAQFFSLPIPKMIWEKTKVLQNDDFVKFIEECRNWK